MNPGSENPGGRILLFTGEGKGKTTAGLGMVLRACGHGQRVLIVQFIKENPATGEIEGCRHLPGVKIIQTGRGFLPQPGQPEFSEHRRAARQGLELAGREMVSQEYDLIILDEICNAVFRGLLPEDEVVEVIRRAAPKTCVVLTGRNATAGLIDLADTATEMRCLKHALQSGRRAQEGVEY